MKILLDSNAPWAPTGYGLQGASLARRLRDAGHQVTYYCNYGLHGGIIEWEGIRCLPGTVDGYDDPIVHAHVRAVQPDLVITLFDVWVWANRPFPMPLEWLHEDEAPPRWAAWVPIDHEPLGLGNRKALSKVKYAIAMSEFGQRMMADAGVKSTYIPHAVEKEFGYTAAGRREFRRIFLIPEDAFVFGSVGLNRNYPGRKGFDRLIEAFSKVEDKNSYLYLHTHPDTQAGSIDLDSVIQFYGVQGRVLFPDAYNYVMGLSQAGMNAVYSGIDCYVQATHGEGFGLPVLESQACGCPVIATDCTSMTELCCPDTSMLIEPATHYLTPDIGHRFLIDIPKLTAAMDEAVRIYRTDATGYRSMRANAGKWANGWDWDKVWNEAWLPFLAEVEADIKRSPAKKWKRGGAQVFEVDGRFRKQDSAIHQAPAVRKELALMLTLDHPNIIRVLAHGEEDGRAWFDMPRLHALDEVKPESLTEEQKQRILTGVADALNYLHLRELAHRDVHPSNVLLDDECNPYLIDFEWAHACDGEPCVDFKPWEAMDKAVPSVQFGGDQRGYHTIVAHLRGIDLTQKTHGYKGVPYQAIDGVGERDCQLRWDIMKPDVAGKSVIDVGCNLGWFVRKSLDEGAQLAEGVDNDAPVVASARTLGAGTFYTSDLAAWADLKSWRRYDVAFCLSVLQHLEDPDRVLRWLTEHADTLYIEIPPRFITPYMAEVLMDADLLGESERGRPIWRVKVREAVPA